VFCDLIDCEVRVKDSVLGVVIQIIVVEGMSSLELGLSYVVSDFLRLV